jgi:chromosome segregation ATPase
LTRKVYRMPALSGAYLEGSRTMAQELPPEGLESLSRADKHRLQHIHEHLQRIDRHLENVDVVLKNIAEDLAAIRVSQGHVEGSEGRDEGRTMEVLARLERLLEKTMALGEQLTADGAKFDAFTTAYGNVIDSAVARIIAEIGKQGTVSPEVQAAADHLSALADNLIALNATNADRIMKAGLPDPVPPGPEPIPPAPDPVVPPVEARRR